MFGLHGFTLCFSAGAAASIITLFVFELILQTTHKKATLFQRILLLLTGLYLSLFFSLRAAAADIPLFAENRFFLFLPLGLLPVILSRKCGHLFTALLLDALLVIGLEIPRLLETESFAFLLMVRILLDALRDALPGLLCGFLLGKLFLICVPPLRRLTGILQDQNGTFQKKRNDSGVLVFLAFAVFITVFAVAPSEAAAGVTRAEPFAANVDARNVFLWDVTTDTVLYEKESEQKIAPASTAKMLTALTALTYCDPDEEVLAGEEVSLIAPDASRAWISSGDRLTVSQLLDALLLPSGNDAAYALAVHTGRVIRKDPDLPIHEALAVFRKAMNEKAAALGASNSCFVNPDGYDTEGQYTTAKDLASIAEGVMESDLLCEIVGSLSISDQWLSGKEVTFHNTNELIDPESQYYYEAATGLKTGKSEDAGCCLVSSARIGDSLYLCVVMGSDEEKRWSESLTLYRMIEESL